MVARIKVYGFLKRIVPPRFRQDPASLEFESPMTVYRVLTHLLEIKTLDATVLVNGRIVNPEYAIRNGDELHIISPVDGG